MCVCLFGMGREESTPHPRHAVASRDVEDDDVVWVVVIRGKQTALVLSSVQFVTSFVSFSLIASMGTPAGSSFLFSTQLLTFCTCGFLLLPSFIRSCVDKWAVLKQQSRTLVILVCIYAFILGCVTFISAAMASNHFEECKNLQEKCGRMQAAISMGFIASFSTLGSFLITFLGSVVPRDSTVNKYVRGLATQAATSVVRGTSPRRDGHAFESIPLDAVASPTTPQGSDRSVKDHVPLVRKLNKASSQSSREEEEENDDDDDDDDDNDRENESGSVDDADSVDVMEII